MLLRKIISTITPSKFKKSIKAMILSTIEQPETKYVVNLLEQKDIEGKVVLVTGGTGAIGSAVCQRLFADGAVVGICGRNKEKLSTTIAHIEKNVSNIANTGKLIPVELDVTNTEQIEIAIDKFVHDAGKIDVLINNAGGSARGESKPLHLQTVSVIDQILDLNLRGSILCARKAAQIMVEQRSGKIINMTSVVGMNGKKNMTDYATSKAAIIGFTKSLALELGEYGITVNCVAPGMVNQIPFDAGIPIKQTTTNCLGRFGYTDEVANIITFIISSKADYITGQNFVVDGGRSLGLMGDK